MADSQSPAFQTIAEAIAFLTDNFQRQPSLAEAARHVHLSEFHFQRKFMEWVGRCWPKSRWVGGRFFRWC